jgi:cytochrome c-type biogenesis protein
MGGLLSAFGSAFSATASLALAAAFAWGVLSVALSPCHLSSVPLVVAYMSGGEELPSGRRALWISSAFALGILASVALVGVVTARLGPVFGVALGPCTFAFMAPLLGIALRASGAGAAGYGVLLEALYGLGHSLAVALAGTSLQSLNRWLGWKAGARATGALKAVAGGGVLLGGAYFVWGAL